MEPKPAPRPMSDPQRRWVWPAILPAYVVLLVLLGSLLFALVVEPTRWLEAAGELLGDDGWWTSALIGSSIIAASQIIFLLPVVRLRPPAGTRPRPLAVSLVLGAAVAAGLTLGLALGLTELLAGLLKGVEPGQSPWGEGGDGELLDATWAVPGAFVTLVGSWVVWSLALLLFTRQLWADRVLGRLVRILFGGTVVELLVVVPIDVIVRKRNDCYCATGTFFALCLAATAVLWLAGPGILLALTAKRRRLMRRTYCARCGHAKGPSPGPACPECGHAWGE